MWNLRSGVRLLLLFCVVGASLAGFSQAADESPKALFDQGRNHLSLKEYAKAISAFEKAAELIQRTQQADSRTLLHELYSHLARAHRGLDEIQKAAKAYAAATYYSDKDTEKKVLAEWTEMMNGVMAMWEKGVREKITTDPSLKALVNKYPLVMVHSRFLYGAPAYIRAAYSFNHETADEEKHKNDVQLLFMNGDYPNTFELNMTVIQKNVVADLGLVDFDKDPDPRSITIENETITTWQAKAVEGHVYLERVLDTRGNRFYIVFKVVALDKDSRYMAFIWRRLSGGKVVK